MEMKGTMMSTETTAEPHKQPAASDLATFAAAWLHDPVSIGSVVPSGRALSAAMAQHAARYRHGTIVELGPGTGAITAELLVAGVPRDRLYLVERDPQLVTYLRDRFEGLRVVEGEASRLRSFINRDGLDDVCAVVSGIPLRNISRKERLKIIHQSFRSMRESGSFFQFTYNHLSPISQSMAERMGLVSVKLGYVWRNLPPASIWQFRRISEDSSLRSGRPAAFS
jgi:phosphatidylethanolamine/phosphatidyl-N-methylethanolamine N-methyltransferase